MIEIAGQVVLSRLVPTLAGLAMLAAAGCTSTDLDDVAPLSVTDPARASKEQPIDTGTYPNLNIAPKSAATPLTPAEKKAKLAQLSAAQAGQQPGAPTETEDARKKRLKLLADEQNNTLKVIEQPN